MPPLVSAAADCSGRFSPFVLVALLLAGCGPIGMTQQLAGVWVGEPETAEQRAARSPSRLAGAEQAEQAAEAPREQTLLRTDLEGVDIRLTFDFGTDGTIEMWEGDDRDASLRGAWRVVSSEANSGLIEVRVKRPRTGEQPAHEAGDSEAVEEKRWFAIRLFDEGKAFTLVEENADRGFGALSFRRQSGSKE